jgi:hypothetical protein
MPARRPRPRPRPGTNAGLARLRGALQAARRARGLDDETYYAALSDVVGRKITSTTQLSTPEAARCLDRLNGAAIHEERRWQGAREPMLAHIRQKLMPQVRGADGEPISERYVEAILRRQRDLPAGTACPLDAATPQELRGLIAALNRRLAGG